MALIPNADKCMQSSITTTTGPYQLTTNVGQFKTWRSQKADLSEVFYIAENSDASIWEEGFGTLTYGSPDTISRATLLSSSTGSAIDWSGVTVYVMSAPLALQLSGRYVSAKTMWVPENRRPTTAVGAANKTIAAADVAGIFTLDNSAATRSITLPALSAVGEGFSFRFMGLSHATLLSLIPNGSEAIDYSSGGTTVKLPGKTWIDVWHDGSQWRTSYPYGQRVKLLELTVATAATLIDTGGSFFPDWANVIGCEFSARHGTNNTAIAAQFYDSTPTLKTGGSDYYSILSTSTSTNSGGVTAATSSGTTFIAGGSNDANYPSEVKFDIINVRGTRPTLQGSAHFTDQGGTFTVDMRTGNRVNFAGPLTGMKITISSGTITSGTIRLYANA